MIARAASCIVLVILAISCRNDDSRPGPGPSLDEYAKVAQRLEREELEKRSSGLVAAKALMSEATKVTEYRVVSQFNHEYPLFSGRPKFKGYALLAQQEVTAPAAADLASILGSPSSFLPPGSESACLPDPGYIVAFEEKVQMVEVIICFTCNDVWINGVPDLAKATLAISPEARKKLWQRVEALTSSPAANLTVRTTPTASPVSQER